MPDESGYVSLGISVDLTKAAIENAEIVIAEVNPEMPVTHGNSFVHISNIDYMVQNRSPLTEWKPPALTPQIERVARNVATLIDANLAAGSYDVTFNASNMESGVYFYQLISGNNKVSKKMILVK